MTLAKLLRRGPPRADAILGVVNSTAPLMVTPTGAAAPVGPLRLVRSMPSVGDQVVLFRHRDTWLVLGRGAGVCGVPAGRVGFTISPSARIDVGGGSFYLENPIEGVGPETLMLEQGFVPPDGFFQLEVAVHSFDGHVYGLDFGDAGGEGKAIWYDPDDVEVISNGGFRETHPPNPPDGSLRPYDSFFDNAGLPSIGQNEQFIPPNEGFPTFFAINPRILYGNYEDNPGTYTLKFWAQVNNGAGDPLPGVGFVSGTVRVTAVMRVNEQVASFTVPEGAIGPLRFFLDWDPAEITWPHEPNVGFEVLIYAPIGEFAVAVLGSIGVGPEGPFSIEAVVRRTDGGASSDGGLTLMPGVWTIRADGASLVTAHLAVEWYCDGDDPAGMVWSSSTEHEITAPEQVVIPATMPSGPIEIKSSATGIGTGPLVWSAPTGYTILSGAANAIAIPAAVPLTPFIITVRGAGLAPDGFDLEARLYAPGVWEANPNWSTNNGYASARSIFGDVDVIDDAVFTQQSGSGTWNIVLRSFGTSYLTFDWAYGPPGSVGAAVSATVYLYAPGVWELDPNVATNGGEAISLSIFVNVDVTEVESLVYGSDLPGQWTFVIVEPSGTSRFSFKTGYRPINIGA